MINGWSSTKVLILFRLNKQNGRQSRFFILIGRFSKIFVSETTGQNLTKLCKNDLWMVLHKYTSFCSGWTNKMAARADSLFWLAEFQTSSSYETTGPNSTKQSGMMYGRSCTKIRLLSWLNKQNGCQSPVERYRPSWAWLYEDWKKAFILQF